MRFRVKRTYLAKTATNEMDLDALEPAIDVDAPDPVAAVAAVVRRDALVLIGEVEEVTGNAATATCRDRSGRMIVVRAWPAPH